MQVVEFLRKWQEDRYKGGGRRGMQRIERKLRQVPMSCQGLYAQPKEDGKQVNDCTQGSKREP